jgi:4-hydroxy-tetrahydrodipicolinate synthase
MELEELRGIVPPIVTALDQDGAFDAAAQERLTARHLEAGAAAVFVAGTTGEGATLPHALTAKLIAATEGAVAGQVPVLVGALAPGTDLVVEQVRQACALGADGVVVTTPYYFATSDQEVEAHIRQVAAVSSQPVLAYSIPWCTHQAVGLDVVERLFADGVVAGFKDSGHSSSDLLAAVALGQRHGKAVFSGFEPLALDALRAGGAGVVASVGNLAPLAFQDLWAACQSGQWDRAETLHARLAGMVEGLGRLAGQGVGPAAALVGGIKAGLQLQGWLSSRCLTSPLAALPDSLVGDVAAVLAEADAR